MSVCMYVQYVYMNVRTSPRFEDSGARLAERVRAASWASRAVAGKPISIQTFLRSGSPIPYIRDMKNKT